MKHYTKEQGVIIVKTHLCILLQH